GTSRNSRAALSILDALDGLGEAEFLHPPNITNRLMRERRTIRRIGGVGGGEVQRQRRCRERGGVSRGKDARESEFCQNGERQSRDKQRDEHLLTHRLSY